MKTDLSDGPAADGNLEERLSRRFATELEQAERDYPTLARRREDSLERHRRAGLIWPRLAVPVVAVAVLVFGGLVGFGLIARPGDTTPGPGGPAAALGPDGIPNQIDGERVYRVGEKVESQKQGGYLLGGYVFQEMASCPAGAVPPVPCFGLGPTAGSDATTGGIDVSVAIDVSDPNPPALSGWLGAPVVARMKGCTWDNGTPCPPVVMAVVWPTVPTEIAGERVYRATDQASFAAIKGSFLLAGRFLKPSVVPPCPAPIGKSDAEQQLIPYCYLLHIDGLQLAPKSSIDVSDNEIVVARVHVNDELAAQCPTDVKADCQAGIVVESVVWRSDELLTGAPNSGTPASVPVLNPASAGVGTGNSSESAGVMPPPPPPSIGPVESGNAEASGNSPASAIAPASAGS